MSQVYTGMQEFPDQASGNLQQPHYVGAVPEHYFAGHCDHNAYPIYSIAPPQLKCYNTNGVPDLAAFSDYGDFDAGSAFGCLHYLPPDAISSKYYALQDPNVYLADETQKPSTDVEAYATTASPITTEVFAKMEVDEPPMGSLTPRMGSVTPPMGSLTPPMGSLRPPCDLHADMPKLTETTSMGILATPTLAYPEHSSPVSALAPRPIPSPSPTPPCSVLPKQRRNRDDPGGDTGPVAQCSAQFENQTGSDYAEGARARVADSGDTMTCGGRVKGEDQPVVVPSQWKLGAILDKLRFPEYGGDWDALMCAINGREYQACMPRSDSPLSPDDMEQLMQLRVGLGLSAPGPPRTPTTPPTTPPINADEVLVYSPTTGRRIPVVAGPAGPILQLTKDLPSAKRPHKRGTTAACAFCRRRKIACGGPQEGDEARRCG
ncbi:hypothetical protein BD310DRAFT_951510 [Dichomitus squalens]|uniref:Uncharacterized protein n=1 Tax=Dichomitus squalens TaxID=114155 RepID=A0A4Q9PJP2_9APHY|nr:hypothetical protein BD310DRAFT_951510 [Dichomitus squalens]